MKDEPTPASEKSFDNCVANWLRGVERKIPNTEFRSEGGAKLDNEWILYQYCIVSACSVGIFNDVRKLEDK